jgi:uncharacterized RDD family membrane protein YckC
VVLALATWIYYAYFESGQRQGTPGKMTQRIGVTNLGVGRLNFLQASRRYIWRVGFIYLAGLLGGSTILGSAGSGNAQSAAITFAIYMLIASLITILGYLAAAFTKQKQALHDLLAQTIVVKA